MDDEAEDPAWNNLLSWLQAKNPRIKDELLVCSKWIPGAGRGLFTTKDVSPNTPLFTVPETAHLNINSLSPLYCPSTTSRLTAIQLISMHLFLHRPDQGADKRCTDDDFGPYIAIIPKEFEGHPLSWLIRSLRGEPQDVFFLVDCLPPATQKALNVMADRFWKDWKVVSKVLQANPPVVGRYATPLMYPFVPEDHTPTYLWAWLNVNTRCVYHRIHSSPSHPDNLTLCPLLDLANHTSSPGHAMSKTPIPTFFSPSASMLKKGDEVYLRYGPHSNNTLFTEYGFVEKDPLHEGQADVSDIIESLFHEKGSLGEWMKTTLEAMNYWGDWTLHETPEPAHPSYRLLPALRLLQLSPLLSPPLSVGTSTNDQTYDSPDLQTWHETILGQKDIISSENEDAVWRQLFQICEIAAKRAEVGLIRLQQACYGENLDGWKEYAVEAIRILWLEEKRVATALMRSIESGQATD